MVWIKNIAAKLAWVAVAFGVVKAGRPFLEGYGAVIGLLAVIFLYMKVRERSGTVGELVAELWNDHKGGGLLFLSWLVSMAIIAAMFDLPAWKILCWSWLVVLVGWGVGLPLFLAFVPTARERRRTKGEEISPQPEERAD